MFATLNIPICLNAFFTLFNHTYNRQFAKAEKFIEFVITMKNVLDFERDL